MKRVRIPKSINEDIAKCPFCNKDISIVETTVDNTNKVIWSIHCDCGSIPNDFYRCNPKMDELPLLIHSWNTKIVPYINSIDYDEEVELPICPTCKGYTVLLPVYDKRFKGYKIRPVCINNRCRLPNQWNVVSDDPYKLIDVTNDIIKWNKELPAFIEWRDKPIDVKNYKVLAKTKCSKCGRHIVPTLQKSNDIIGKLFWSCPKCSAPIKEAHLTDTRRIRKRRRAQSVSIRSIGRTTGSMEPICAICKRSQSTIEATGSQLERHHVNPLSDGGTDDTNNVMLLCTECHRTWHEVHKRLQEELLVKVDGLIKEEEKEKTPWYKKIFK